MSKYIIDELTLKNIADAIRNKSESSEAIAVTSFADRISSLSGGIDPASL